jgi:outer membrane autotransporter protein
VNYTIALDGAVTAITASANSASTIASTLGITTQEATALSTANTAVATGDATGLTAMTTALNTGGADATKAAEQVSVQADSMGAGAAASVAAGGQVLGAASTRLASLRSGSQYASTEGTGFATGGGGVSKTGWIKPFGNWIRQGTRNNIKGYDADTYGVAFGIDGAVNKKVRLGVSFAYSQTDVDGKGSGKSKSDINSYQGTVYGDYTAQKYYVEGMFAFSRNDTDTSRILNFGGLDRTVLGDYSSDQYMVKVGGGLPNKIKGNLFVTPTAGLSWTHVVSDSYTETGGGGFSQIVNPEDTDVLVASVGAKVHTKMKSGKGFLVPELRGGLNYDFAGDEGVASATFTGGGSAFTVTGAEVAQLSGNAGVGMTYTEGQFSVAANYDAEVKEDFVSHSGTFEARFKF